MHGIERAFGIAGRLACRLPDHRFCRCPDQCRQTRRVLNPNGVVSSQRPFARPVRFPLTRIPCRGQRSWPAASLANPYGSAARSAFCSTANPGLPRFRLLLSFRPVAVSPSDSADRAFSLSSPSGMLPPSGSTLRPLSLSANPPSRAARSPFAPHSHFYY